MHDSAEEAVMHLGAHAVDLGRLYATQRILGVIGVFWALFAGTFLSVGGARHLTQPAWQPLLQFTHAATTVPLHECYRVVGAILLASGVLGILGLIFTTRLLSLASAALGTVWCATAAGYLGMSNVNVENGGNFVAVSIAFNGLIYLVRFFLLVAPAQPGRSVRLYDRG